MADIKRVPIPEDIIESAMKRAQEMVPKLVEWLTPQTFDKLGHAGTALVSTAIALETVRLCTHALAQTLDEHVGGDHSETIVGALVELQPVAATAVAAAFPKEYKNDKTDVSAPPAPGVN